MSTFHIQPGNPYDFSREELVDLVNEVHSQVADVNLVLPEKVERGYGVTFYEVIQVVADVRGAGVDYVLAAVVIWARKRWKRDKDAGRQPRPRTVVLLDSDGNKLKSIDIDEPDGEPKEVEPGAG